MIAHEQLGPPLICGAAQCEQRATHHVMDTRSGTEIHACDEHYAATRPLVHYAREELSVAGRVLCDVIESCILASLGLDRLVLMRLDTTLSQETARENMALRILQQLVSTGPLRELLAEFAEEER